MTDDNHRVSAVDAKAAILADKQAREEQAKQELDRILKETNCTLDAVVVLRGGQIFTQILFVANDPT